MSVWGKAVVRETTKQWPLHGARRHSQRSPQSPQVAYGQAGTKLFENPSDDPVREIISNEIGDSIVTRLIPRCLLQRRYLKPRRYDGVRPALCGARILSTPSTHSPHCTHNMFLCQQIQTQVLVPCVILRRLACVELPDP